MGAYLGASVYNDSQVTEEWVKEQIEKNGKGVFWAIYDETTFEEIETAVNDGKTVICIYQEAENVFYYGLLEHFNGIGGTAIFTALDYSKSLKQWSIISDVWYYQEKSLLPSVNAEDNEKVLTVKDGQLQLDYLPVGKFGLETPLTFKKDTAAETVIGFNSDSGNYLDVLRVDKIGEPKFEPLPFSRLGISSPMKFNETETDVEIVFETAHKSHFVLQARNQNGDVEFVENLLVCNLSYNQDTQKWTADKSWSLIFEYLTYSMPVKMRIEIETNDFIWADVLNEYQEDVGGSIVQHIVFQHLDFCIGSNKIYVCSVDWKSDNTFTLNETRYNPPEIYNP